MMSGPVCEAADENWEKINAALRHGVPITNAAAEVIGAIGVAGRMVENDHAVASAGAAAVR